MHKHTREDSTEASNIFDTFAISSRELAIDAYAQIAILYMHVEVGNYVCMRVVLCVMLASCVLM